MVDVVLVRCRSLTSILTGDAGKYGGRSKPGFGVLYIQSYLRKHGYTSVVLDRYHEDYIELDTDDFVARIHEFEPRFVGLSALTSQEQDAENIARGSKKLHPGVPIILGGVHFSSLPDEGLALGDYVVRGDGEHAMLEILRGDHEPGLIDGRLMDPDDVPFPTAEDFRATSYEPESYGRGAFHLITARGCPFNCYFCKDGVRGSSVRHHSVDYVADMFEFVVREFGTHSIFIMDDIFIPTEERLRAYVAEFKKRRLRVRLEIFFHPNVIRERLLPVFWELGVRRISLGIESGSEEILATMGKRTTRKVIEEACRLLHGYGFEVNGLFIVGHRGETPQTLRDTLDFARELPLSTAWFSYMVPFPGTPVWDEGVEKFGRIVNSSMADWGNKSAVFVPHGLSEEQLSEGMAEAQLIRREIKRRWSNVPPRLKRKVDELATRAHVATWSHKGPAPVGAGADRP